MGSSFSLQGHYLVLKGKEFWLSFVLFSAIPIQHLTLSSYNEYDRIVL